jgi:hypothetical protein
VNTYKVTKVINTDKNWSFPGKVEPGATVHVAQWGLVPARFQAKKTWVADLKPGEVRTLMLEVLKKNIDKLDEMEISEDDPTDNPLLYEPRE